MNDNTLYAIIWVCIAIFFSTMVLCATFYNISTYRFSEYELKTGCPKWIKQVEQS